MMKESYISAQKRETLLILIREDLKSQKFFDNLRSLGLEDTFYQSDLTEIILKEVGLNAESKQDQYFYYCLVRQYAPQVTANQKSLNALATDILSKLLGLVLDK